ncbi:MAG: DNA repair protein RecO [Bacilli bacterium]|nr:DNA repair protein RecO [Bacilli bacterium]
MISKVEGFIVSETPYGDSSKIIHVLTKEHGVIGIMAKGSKSLKSKNRATTLKFTYGIFNIYYKENKLSTLIDVEVIDELANIKNDITLISYLNYLTELTTQVAKQSIDEDIYDIFINAVLLINKNLNPMVITNIVEIKYLKYLGVFLNLDNCYKCGSNKDIVTISFNYGGLICKECYHDEEIVDLKMIKILRNYLYIDLAKISKIDLDETIVKKINLFIDLYYEQYTGLYLQSKKFLKTIID